jgi:hypothetical protein
LKKRKSNIYHSTISKENDGSIQNASDLMSKMDEHERDKTKSSLLNKHNIILFISKIKKI